MPEYLKITIVCSLLLFLAIPSPAEFYQYVDSKGITHFTDKISTIPTQYQSQLERRLAKNNLPEGLPYPEYEENQPAEIKSKAPKLATLSSEQSRLLDQKKILDQGFEILLAEKQRMESNKDTIQDKESIVAYNQKVKEINKKIRLYKEEENRFIIKLERYNASIDSLLTD